jgi:hypothetical protein
VKGEIRMNLDFSSPSVFNFQTLDSRETSGGTKGRDVCVNITKKQLLKNVSNSDYFFQVMQTFKQGKSFFLISSLSFFHILGLKSGSSKMNDVNNTRQTIESSLNFTD